MIAALRGSFFVIADFVTPPTLLNSAEDRGIRITSEGMSDTPFLSVSVFVVSSIAQT
jgi:hypothetical protein